MIVIDNSLKSPSKLIKVAAMDKSKVVVLLLIGVLVSISWYASSVLRTSEKSVNQLTEVEKFFNLLNRDDMKVHLAKEEELSNSESSTKKWIWQDKQHFTSQMPEYLFPIYGDVHLSIKNSSPITCGQVKFDSRASDWSNFIASSRANVALLEGDEQLSDHEFNQLYQQVCL